MSPTDLVFHRRSSPRLDATHLTPSQNEHATPTKEHATRNQVNWRNPGRTVDHLIKRRGRAVLGFATVGRMSELETMVQDFARMLLKGRSLDAMERYYAPEVCVFENRQLARAGKAQCLQYERDALASHPEPPRFKLVRLAINENDGGAFSNTSCASGVPTGARCAWRRSPSRPWRTASSSRSASITKASWTRATSRDERRFALRGVRAARRVVMFS